MVGVSTPPESENASPKPANADAAEIPSDEVATQRIPAPVDCKTAPSAPGDAVPSRRLSLNESVLAERVGMLDVAVEVASIRAARMSPTTVKRAVGVVVATPRFPVTVS